MSAPVERLVRMANQIAAALSVQSGDPVGPVAAHLQAFWAPAMRARIIAHHEAGGAGLTPIAAQAVARLAAAGARAS